MTTRNEIQVANVQSNKSENMVWAVFAQGNEQEKIYCKSPYKAMRYAFFMKKQTGLYISDISLAMLSLAIQKQKEASMTAEQKEVKAHIDEVVDEFIEEHSVDNVLARADEAKRKRPRRSKKSEEAAPAVEAEPEAKPKAKRQRKSSKKQEEKVAA